MNGEYISLETAKKTRRYNILLRRIKILKKENERLHSVIKEVRKYIENNTYKIEWGDLEQDNEDININEDLSEKDFIESILEILDKENSNG